VEIPIPTYYGDEICYVNGFKYAGDVARSVVDYELHELGVRHRPEYEVDPVYSFKESPLSSHSQLIELVGTTPRKVLDVGCGRGELGHELRTRQHHVVGIDTHPPSLMPDEFIKADLAQGLPLDRSRKFDVVILADVLEHMADPLKLLQEAKAHLSERGTLLVSLPNAVHWSVRAQVFAGKFDYTNKGILDRGHLRFFTGASAERLFREAGLSVKLHRTTPVPWENVVPKAVGRFLLDKLEKGDYFFGQLRPNVFAYQHVFELTAHGDA
jgi:SAM-dependent methyltransferase